MNFAGSYEPLVAFLLGWTVKTTVLLVLASIAAVLLRRQSAALRHRIWAIAIVASLALPLVAVVVPAWHILAAVQPVAVQNASQTIIVTSSAVAPPVDATPARYWDTERLTGAALLLWALGTMLIALRLAAGLARLWRISAYSKRVPESACSALDELRESFGIERKVLLFEAASAATMPMTWGIVRPRIVLPSDAAEWDDARRRIVLSHELAHVARCDWLLQVCGEALRACFWFHPLAWIAGSWMRQESERACDDAVLNSGIGAPEYASQLLSLAQTLKAPSWRFSLALAVARPSNLERRFAAMLNPSIRRRPLSPTSNRAAILLAAALLLPLAALTLSAKPLPAPKPALAMTPAAVVQPSLPSPAGERTQAAPSATPRDNWPAGRGRTAFLATCSSCHAPQDVIGKNLDSRGWTDEINRMIQLGATGSDQDFRLTLQYLTTNFGTKSPAGAANLSGTREALPEPAGGAANGPSQAQARSAASGPPASVSGTVADPSGALIPSANVTLTDVATGEYRAIPTGAVGEFIFSNVIPDNYELSIAQPGFQPYKRTIQLSAGEQLNLHSILLSVGVLATEITVSASGTGTAELQSAPSALPGLPPPPPAPGSACSSVRVTQPPYSNPVEPGPAPNRVRVGGNVELARLIQQTPPVYPDIARAARMQGTVVLNAIIGKDGDVVSVCFVSGPTLMMRSAMDAAIRWRYSPTFLDGQPVETATQISVVFALTN